MRSKEKFYILFRYLITGAVTTFIGLTVFYFILLFFLNEKNILQLQIANIISWISAVLFSFFTNKKYVFKNHNERVFVQFIKFLGLRIGTLIFENILLYIFTNKMGYSARILKLYLVIITTLLNYFLCKLFVFYEVKKKNNITGKA